MRRYSTLSDLSKYHSFELKNMQNDIVSLKNVLSTYSEDIRKFQESQSDRILALEKKFRDDGKPSSISRNNAGSINFEFSEKGGGFGELSQGGALIGTNLSRYAKQLDFLVEPYTSEINIHLLNWFSKSSSIVLKYFPSLSESEICMLLCRYLPISIRSYSYTIINSENPPNLNEFYSFLQNLCSDECDMKLDNSLLVLKTFFSSDFHSNNFLEIISSIENVARTLPLQSSIQRFRLILNKLASYIPQNLHHLITNAEINTIESYNKIIRFLISPSNLTLINSFLRKRQVKKIDTSDKTSIKKHCVRCGLENHWARECKIYPKFFPNICSACEKLHNKKLFHSDAICKSRLKNNHSKNSKGAKN